MVASAHVMFAAIGWCLVGVGGVTLPAYTELYTRLVRSDEMYQAEPTLLAPIRPPWPVLEAEERQEQYRQALYRHEAYIRPSVGTYFGRIQTDLVWLIDAPRTRDLADDQKDLVDYMEVAASRARWEVQTGLHPHNVEAQHISSLRRLDNALDGVLRLLEAPAHVHDVTSELSPERLVAFVRAHRMLVLEKTLVQAAKPLASRLPVFV